MVYRGVLYHVHNATCLHQFTSSSDFKDHCTNWRTLNKGSGQIIWPFKFFISIFVVLVLLFSLTFYNLHGHNYLNGLRLMVSLIMMNMELSAKALRESLHTPRLKKQVQFLSIYTLKFISCLNLMKICIYHLEHACVEHKKLRYVYSSLILFPKGNNDFSNMSYFLYVVKKTKNGTFSHCFLKKMCPSLSPSTNEYIWCEIP